MARIKKKEVYQDWEVRIVCYIFVISKGGNLSKYLISKKSLVKSILMSPYYFLPIVVAVLNPPSLQ